MRLTPFRAQKLVSEWMAALQFEEHWEVIIKVNNDPADEKKKARHLAAYITVEEGYWVAYMTINAFNIPDEKELDHTISHELLHVLLWPMRQVVFGAFGEQLQESARAMDEKTTERLSRVVCALRGRKYGRRKQHA